MTEGDVVLTRIPQADGVIKNRPAIILREMPAPYHDFLICGVSTQLRQEIANFDEVINSDDEDFVASGLLSSSLIRLSFLAIQPRKGIVGVIGSISPDRHNRLLTKLCDYLLL